MTTYSDNPKVLRLNEIYRELNYRSFNAFANDVGSTQPVVANYIKGKRVPTAEFLLLVLKRFPQYNQDWLIDGLGEKYNPVYVECNPNGFSCISGNSNNGDNLISNNIKNDDSQKVKDLYEQLVESLRSQIRVLEKQNDLLAQTNSLLHKAMDKILNK